MRARSDSLSTFGETPQDGSQLEDANSPSQATSATATRVVSTRSRPNTAAHSVGLWKSRPKPWPLRSRDICQGTQMTSKRQQTRSKMAREREVRERRARKLEKKYAAAVERKARAADASASTDDVA